jgi:3-dehydroquinate synthetase
MQQILNKNLYSRVEKLFKKFNLPTQIPESLNIEQLLLLMTKDKKNKAHDKI